ncbi:hypothetical protein LHV25_01490 [Providencia rettgeri]|uniref:pyocin knob domain-containing protein n=1 Tax=Providencia rettgeri TaxID=587 RepID=UPI001CFF3EC2|nr:pyocin knob domain-containing protein [Providencia rettgeri]MCB4853688.1 hypothetical protein [Providencia rettgeri]MCD6314416.1 hypothetical protein [Providencia rettgeri]MCS4542611.1 hypothetical protein [Providencia rettgeri]MDB9557954.1 hypothetical protein [Providencia rettgeri]
MYSTGTVTTTANSTKLVGTGTKWLNNINRVSAEQAIQIQIGTTVHNNSIQSIQSDTELTLNFPLPTAATGAKYVILTTMVHSVSDAMNKIVSMNGANVQFSDILTRWMTEQGIITVTLPDQTTQQLRTTKEMDKQLDGKLNKTGGEVSGDLSVTGTNFTVGKDASMLQFKAGASVPKPFINYRTDSTWYRHYFQDKTGTLMHVRDFGIGAIASVAATAPTVGDMNSLETSGFYGASGAGSLNAFNQTSPCISAVRNGGGSGTGMVLQIQAKANGSIGTRFRSENVWSAWIENYNVTNTTKDTNGNLKAASPVVKLFADHIELNEESEGVEMEHLGIGHYLIKGVVGFNADGAWGINNGFVIPQDHNGKNMVLIDYEVRPDGDIEVFVFHQQNADMPERFQNKRIKHFDEEGVPVYFENYEPCDVPESRWIDMRVEMPPNSLYNQKQAEAERLAKIEAERLAQEEAKRIAEEAKGAQQEAAEREQYGLDDNSALL